jgi:hypothetical protein
VANLVYTLAMIHNQIVGDFPFGPLAAVGDDSNSFSLKDERQRAQLTMAIYSSLDLF